MAISGKAVGECLGERLGERLGTSLTPRASFPWSGIDESNQVLVLDADIDVATETGISLWSDQSGASNDLAQSTTSKQPAYTTFNSENVASFDGTDDDMLNETLGSMGAVGSSYTIFVVAKFDATGGRGLFEFTDVSGDVVNKGLSSFQSGADLILRAFDGTSFSDATVGFTDTVSMHIFEMVHTTASRSIRVDGGTPGTNAVNRSMVALENLYLGRIGGNIFRGDIQMSSILVWKSELSAGDLSTVRTRLADRWSVTLP